jgi:hypothetical protein
VHAAGVAFPELLQTRGAYQIKPPLPFVPGSEVAGIVRSAPDGATVKAGDRVAAFCALGGFAETAVAPPFLTFALPDELDFCRSRRVWARARSRSSPVRPSNRSRCRPARIRWCAPTDRGRMRSRS